MRRVFVAVILAMLSFCTVALHQRISIAQETTLNFPDDNEATMRSNGKNNTTISISAKSHHAKHLHEPHVNRWQRRFSSANGKSGGHLFFKHIRKAGGTTMRKYLDAALEHHGQSRTLQQFLNNIPDREEATRHFPFLNSQQKAMAEHYYDNLNNLTNSTKAEEDEPKTKTTARQQQQQQHDKVYYIEQEFSTMDWECRNTDPRWNASTLSIILLRQPIERHLSEFFYSGAPARGTFEGKQFGAPALVGNGRLRSRFNKLHVDREKLYAKKNETYARLLSAFLGENLRVWAESRPPRWGTFFKWFFDHHYRDNFQVRALAGCASGECLDEKNISGQHREHMMRESHHSFATINENNATIAITSSSSIGIDSVCTMHPFYPKRSKCIDDKKTCPLNCDGPCFYPAAAWGPLQENDLTRAKHSLEGFDLVLLTESFDTKVQLAFLSDVMGIPREILASYTSEMSNLTENSKRGELNINSQKSGSREKTHYYRDLMSNLMLPHLVNSLFEENRMEIELYDHAVRLNKAMTERWKREVDWSD